MLEIKLHEVIDAESRAWIYEWYGMPHPFTLETLQKLLEDNPDEHDIKLNIHCDGGSVTEGFALYDCLRTSGRNIYCNVEGGCHSMAIVLLLAAPKNQRTANPNSQFLIHEVQGGVEGSTTAVERYAEEMRDMQERMLDIYADRTGYDRAALAEAMAEEKMRDADYMLAHGFIGAINQYNTNKKVNMNLIEKFKNFISQVEVEAQQGEQNAAPANDELTQLRENIATLEAERNEARQQVETLTAERDEQMNRAVEAENKVTDLTEQVNALNEQKENLTNEVATLNEQVKAKDEEIHNLKEQLGSNFVPQQRMNGIPAGEGKQDGKQQDSEERKNEVRDKLGRNKK